MRIGVRELRDKLASYMPLDEIGKQRAHHARVLRAALANAQDVFLSLIVDTQGDEHHSVTEVDAIDHDHGKNEIIESAAKHTSSCRRRAGIQ